MVKNCLKSLLTVDVEKPKIGRASRMVTLKIDDENINFVNRFTYTLGLRILNDVGPVILVILIIDN